MAILAVPSLVGLLIQAIGALLIATLCAVLLKTVQRGPLQYWTLAWLSLFTALVTLLLTFRFPGLRTIGTPLYMLGEYVFGYLVFAGCRLYARGEKLRRREAWLLLPAAAFAAWISRLGGGDFNVFFTVHTLVYSYLFFAAFRVLWQGQSNQRSVTGISVMRIALLLLTIDYLHYAPLFAASSYGLVPPTMPYLEYAPLYDLIFMIMLAFGMVMVVTGDVQHELEMANLELGKRRDHLEATAQFDHLTSALNRHAFYSLVGDTDRGRGILSGSAAVADIDNLKAINDRFGHVAGDAAIRAVASAIRGSIRADDLLFRWGGDEFLVLLIGISEADARIRLGSLNAQLSHTMLPGVPEAVTISASVGFAPFNSASSLDQVIAMADEAMYGRKKRTVGPQGPQGPKVPGSEGPQAGRQVN